MPTTPTRQFALNVVVPLRADGRAELDAVLARISDETTSAMRKAPVPNALLDFAQVPGIHYARWVVVPGRGDPYQSPGGRPASPPPPTPDALALNVWFDGTEGDASAVEAEARAGFVKAFVAAGRHALDAIYTHAEGYPAGGRDEAVAAYLLEHHVGASALYFGSPGRSVGQILEEAALARKVRSVVDELRARGPLLDAPAVRRVILDAVGESIPPFPAQKPAWGSLLARAPLAALAVPASALLPWLLVLENTDPVFQPVYSAAERAHVDTTTRGENLFFENALSNVVEVKPGLFRRTLLRAVLFAIDTLARDYFVRGSLGKIPSIHAAHWYLLDGGRRLVFVSNYDSSWESYLGDFIDQAGTGLTAVWSNTSGYPRTHFLAFAGSNAGNQFKAWSHHVQVGTRVWYAAYPDLSIVEINDATMIRRGLADDRAVRPETWLAKLL
jgi:hypothetical protein